MRVIGEVPHVNLQTVVTVMDVLPFKLATRRFGAKCEIVAVGGQEYKGPRHARLINNENGQKAMPGDEATRILAEGDVFVSVDMRHRDLNKFLECVQGLMDAQNN